ncbi:MAG: hypothetical protein KUG77_08985 [Nannocystaceae bacterium]|nr:hypothetical protein [Nannocystaceae bacterium]
MNCDPRTIAHRELAGDLLESQPILLDKIGAACEAEVPMVAVGLTEVLRFINLTAYARQSLTPSPRVDLAWHEFILCTRPYVEFCDRWFGRMIHHDPGGSDQRNRDRFKQTMQLYNQFFGPPDPQWWGQPHPQVAVSNCGGCESV